MREIAKDKTLVACCGLYCGACKAYINEKCDGCKKNVKATWCKIRTCCNDNKLSSCADCKTVPDANDCKKFNNFISKIFGLLFRSDRKACITRIKKDGYEKYTDEMASKKIHTIKK